MQKASRTTYIPAQKKSHLPPGLLQDMAIPVLATVKKEDYGTLWEHWNENEDAWLHLLEKESFGYDHPQIGALMAEAWDLPEYLVGAISGHHSWNGESNTEPAVRLVSLLRDNDEVDSLAPLVEKCRLEFGMDEEKISEMISNAFEDAKDLSHSLS